MRRFHSYGPVDPRFHFCVERRALVERCVQQLAGAPDEGGHFFTMWGPRQTGKTWIMRRAAQEIRACFGDRYAVGMMSMQRVILEEDDPEEALLRWVPAMVADAFDVEVGALPDWSAYLGLFRRRGGVFDRPIVLLIDEFDSLPPRLIDRLVRLFRDIYLDRGSYLLHGLALLGVRAVLGVDGSRGSPFNVQRSIQVPNLTRDEVLDLFNQYQSESGQRIAPEAVEQVFHVTRGQPGLTSWFGELLTEKYNPDPKQIITIGAWEDVYRAACQIEPNNTVLNLIKKARGEYRDHVMALFSRSDILFSFDQDWCNFLYLNGIIDFQEGTDTNDERVWVCRFSSPFIQLRLYNALAHDLFDDRLPALPLDPLDTLADVFAPAGLDLAALLGRYRSYLARLKGKGLDPWKGQPRRQDLHLTEATGHFHLYTWLRDAVGRECVVSPEFPTGNGKVDLLVQWKGQRGVIEVKSFRARRDLPPARQQAARYAKSQGLASATLALFVPTDDEAVLAALSGEEMTDGVRVVTVAIGWG
jgi:hypothetical protein